MSVGGLLVEVDRKPIRNLHIKVYPPDGAVRAAVPASMDDEALRLAVIERLGWIRRQQHSLREQPREPLRRMVAGESHWVWGRKHRLRIVEDGAHTPVVLRGGWLELHVSAGADPSTRERRLLEWYRTQLRAALPSLTQRWCERLDLAAPSTGIKRMRTKWGSCNPERGSLWLNLELAKKPPACLEYVLVHELLHLIERNHTPRFFALMDRHLPGWRLRQSELNAQPLAHEVTWGWSAGAADAPVRGVEPCETDRRASRAHPAP